MKAVIFDCDGVLVDSEVLALEVELTALAELGVVYRPEDFQRLFMGMPDSAFFPALSADMQARGGGPLPDDFPQLHADRYLTAVRERLTAVAGAGDAVAGCQLPKAVASSSKTGLLQLKLEMVGLWDAFKPHVYSGDLVGRGKPAPDLFLYVADRLGVLQADCIVIEDSINGVRAGRAAGMEVWGFTGGGHCLEQSAKSLAAAGAHRVLSSWSEFGPALDAAEALAP